MLVSTISDVVPSSKPSPEVQSTPNSVVLYVGVVHVVFTLVVLRWFVLLWLSTLGLLYFGGVRFVLLCCVTLLFYFGVLLCVCTVVWHCGVLLWCCPLVCYVGCLLGVFHVVGLLCFVLRWLFTLFCLLCVFTLLLYFVFDFGCLRCFCLRCVFALLWCFYVGVLR